jgi:hypothetical protein
VIPEIRRNDAGMKAPPQSIIEGQGIEVTVQYAMRIGSGQTKSLPFDEKARAESRLAAIR